MNKFVTTRKDLLNMFSKAAKSVDPDIKKEDMEPVLDKALNSFKREMNKPIENFTNDNTPNEMKAHIFDILTKHFIMCLMNEKVFMEDKNISEISKRIESLLD